MFLSFNSDVLFCEGQLQSRVQHPGSFGRLNAMLTSALASICLNSETKQKTTLCHCQVKSTGAPNTGAL